MTSIHINKQTYRELIQLSGEIQNIRGKRTSVKDTIKLLLTFQQRNKKKFQSSLVNT